MRVLVWADMEGMSGIADHAECWPVFADYWRTGRRAFTDEVAAAALGLLEGGATEVAVANGHGLGWPNLYLDDLPDHVRLWDPEEEIDGTFEVGRHARCGTTDGFVSHTYVPYLAVALDDALVTESHVTAQRAWRFDAPVLGIVGDKALGRQLDGILAGTPFLAVKTSSSRAATRAVYADRTSALQAVREFASACLRDRKRRVVPRRPTNYRATFSFTEPDRAREAEGKHGLALKSSAVLEVTGTDWFRDILPALYLAQEPAVAPLLAILGDLTQITSEDDIHSLDPEKLVAARDYFNHWVGTDQPEWQD
jgi:D-amino peptidase